MVTGLVAGLVAKKITVLDGRLLFKDSTFFDVPDVSRPTPFILNTALHTQKTATACTFTPTTQRFIAHDSNVPRDTYIYKMLTKLETIPLSRISTHTKKTQKMRTTTERKLLSRPSFPLHLFQEKALSHLPPLPLALTLAFRSSPVCADPSPAHRLSVCLLPNHRIFQQHLVLVQLLNLSMQKQ